MNKEMLIRLGILLGGLGMGFLVGDKLAKDRYRKIAQDEIDAVKEHFATKYKKVSKIEEKKGSYAKLEELAKVYRSTLKESGYSDEVPEKDPAENLEPPIYNQYGEEIDVTPEQAEFDLRGEHASMISKGKRRPYVISFEEFNEEKDEYDKDTLTYYAGDNTLADERDEMVDDLDRKIGEVSLDLFGWRSHDENVVYVRNDKLSVDFEIIYDPGKYSVSILGMEEDQESHPKIRKMRDEE